ncbi:carbohydrate esterase family 16 protein [Crassisporium funariophilum]|nr:carbohydrate esterase family 16 protein [Crassisporium funariophilum]
MRISLSFVFFGALLATANAAVTPAAAQRNDGIHLAVGPKCGQLSGTTSDVNAGLDPKKFKTLVSFGDSYTDGGKQDGSPLSPAVLVPPNVEAGGRSTNGLTWVENVANDMGATVKDYAQSGACIDLSLWPSNPNKVDFLGQMKTFLNQSNHLDPETTLYSIFFGINDYLASLIDGDHMQAAANTLINQISILASPPTNARNFMVLDVYGRGTTAPSGEMFKQTIFSALHNFHSGLPNNNSTVPRLNVAYIDFATLWNGVLSTQPGFEAFGYTSTDACTTCTAELGCTTIGMCSDPEHFFYWIPGHPSKETMRLMADYVGDVFSQCRS